MGGSSVAQEVRAVIVDLLPPDVPPEAVTDDATLDEETLGLDSVALVDLLCACEERFGIDLPAEVLLEEGKALSVGDLIRHVDARVRPEAVDQ